MKKFAFVTLAMGAALAFIPSALADSLGYRSNTTNLNDNGAMNAGSMHFTNQVAESSALAMSGMIATFSPQNSTAAVSVGSSRAAMATVSNTGAFVNTADNGSQFDSLLNFGNAGTGILDKGGVLVDISGYQLTLLSGGLSSDNRSQSNGHFFFADNGSFHPGNSASGNNGSAAGRAPALTETPEPGSLVLLGTGLLCMALVLFWKSGKSSAAADTIS